MAKNLRSIVAGDESDDDGPPRNHTGAITTPMGAISANTQFELAADEYNKIESALREISTTGAKVSFMRRRRGETGYKKLGHIPLEEFSEEALIKTWGGGEYIIHFLDSNRKTVKGPMTIMVDELVRGTMDLPPSQSAPVAAVSQGPDLGQLSDLFNKDKDVMLKVMETGQQRSDQMMQMFLQMMMESQKSTMQAIASMSKGGNQSEPMSNILTAMTPLLMEAIFKKREEPASPLFKSIDDIMKLRELFDNNAGEKDTMFDKLIPLLAPMVAGLTSRPQLPAPPRQANPSPPPGAPPAAPAAPDPINAVINQVRNVLPVLVNAARNNTEPVTYADLLFDMTDQPTQDVLCGILERDDWREILFANHPGVLQQSAWFDALRAEILKTDESESADISHRDNQSTTV